MNFKARGEDVESVAYLVMPFLGLLFVLLIFFTCVTVMLKDEKLLGIEVINLPEITQTENEYRTLDELIVNINSQGRIFLNGIPLSPEVLETKLSQLEVFSDVANDTVSVIIRADGAAQHKIVMEVMDICARSGAKYISFGTYSQ